MDTTSSLARQVLNQVNILHAITWVAWKPVEPSTIQKCFKHYASVLSNLSLSTSTFPTLFKKAIVTPIQKLPGATEPEKHRPISLLTLISKVIEKVAYVQLYEHIEPILTQYQHGFHRHRSTLTALLTITDEILHTMDNNHVALLILLDTSKAFDSVNHQLLLTKLHSLHLSTTSINCFELYLTGQSQVVRVSGLESSEAKVGTGVPQGSIIGPLLFLLCTNDLPSILEHSFCTQYADDTQLLFSYDPKSRTESAAIQKKIKEDLRNLSEWCSSNSLLLNHKKTQFLPIAHTKILRRTILLEVLLNGHVLEPCSSARNLGIQFDKNLNFKAHVANLIRTANGRMRNLSKIAGDLPGDVLKTVIESTIINPALYCLPAWSCCTTTDLMKLQPIILLWPAKLISGQRKFDKMGTLLCDIEWMTLEEQVLTKRP